MEYILRTGDPDKLRTACLVVGVFDKRRLTEPASALDKSSEGFLSRTLKRGDLTFFAENPDLIAV